MLLISNGAATAGTSRLLDRLAPPLRERGHTACVVYRDLPSGIFAKIGAFFPRTSLMRRVLASDTVLVHTSVALQIPVIALARMLRKRVLAIAWDVYPASFAARWSRQRLALAGFRRLERLALRWASIVVVPSDDYLPFFGSPRTHVVPMWPAEEWRAMDAANVSDGHTDPLMVAFAGQINAVRGLDVALRSLSRAMTGRSVVLRVYSAQQPGPELEQTGVRVEHRGFVDPDVLTRELKDAHFGLVSLNSTFALPAYPSKLANYVANGLPVIYAGPPLPALQSDLARFSLGLTIDRLAEQPLLGRCSRSQAFVEGRERYMRHVEEGWDRLASLL